MFENIGNWSNVRRIVEPSWFVSCWVYFELLIIIFSSNYHWKKFSSIDLLQLLRCAVSNGQRCAEGKVIGGGHGQT